MLMKKVSLLIVAACMSLGVWAQKAATDVGAGILPKEFNPWKVQRQFDHKRLLEAAAAAAWRASRRPSECRKPRGCAAPTARR